MGKYLGQGLSYKEAKKTKMTNDTVEGADLAMEIGKKVKNDFDNNTLPLMNSIIDTIPSKRLGEAKEIAEKLGVKFPIDVERRIDGGAAVGPHRTSMWQDLDAGRPMEIDALVRAVQELGQLTQTPTHTIDTVLALVQLRAKTAGLY